MGNLKGKTPCVKRVRTDKSGELQNFLFAEENGTRGDNTYILDSENSKKTSRQIYKLNGPNYSKMDCKFQENTAIQK
jgi:hypothetical protein